MLGYGLGHNFCRLRDVNLKKVVYRLRDEGERGHKKSQFIKHVLCFGHCSRHMKEEK